MAPTAAEPTGDGPVVIVSGAPRSGTSMLMQMLRAGGIAPVTDGLRAPDGHNPRGYWEYEPVKTLAADHGWLWGLGGRAVKITTPHVRHLPPDLDCRVIFMIRDVTAVARSQLRMARRPETEIDGAANRLMMELAVTLDGLHRAFGANVLEVAYDSVLESPRAAAAGLARFLGRPLDEAAMAAAVAPALRHARAGPPPTIVPS